MRFSRRLGWLVVMLTFVVAKPDFGAGERPTVINARVDQYGDPLPTGAVARLGTVRLRHEDQASASVAFSPDGKELITSRTQTVVQFWDRSSGKPLRELRQEDTFDSFVVSTDGKILATGGTTGIIVWDVGKGKQVRKIPLKNVQALAMAPDGSLLAAKGEDKGIHVWETASGTERATLAEDSPQTQRLFFANQGKAVVSFSRFGLVRVWNIASGQETRKILTPRAYCAAVSPNGALLACGGRELWDLTTGRKLRQFAGSRDSVESVAFSPDGKILAAADVAGWICLWDVATGKQLRRFKNAGWRTACLAFSPDGKTLAAGDQGRDYVIRLWDVATGKPLQPEAHDSVFRTFAFSPDGSLLATGSWGNYGICLWDPSTGKLLRNFGGSAGVCRVAFTNDGGGILSAGIDRKLRLWQVDTGKAVREYHAGHLVYGMALSPDGKAVISVADVIGNAPGERGQSVVVWDIKTGKRLLEWGGQRAFGNLVPFSPDAKLIAQAEGAELHLWQVVSGQKLLSLKVSNLPKGANLEEAVAFSPDGKTVAAVTCTWGRKPESTIHVWELATGNIIRRLTAIKRELVALEFAPDGRTLAAAGAGLVGLWDVATGKHLLAYQGHDAQVMLGAIAFSGDGTRLAAGYTDTTALVWDMTPGTRRAGMPPWQLGPSDLEQLWPDLAGQDAARAHTVIWTLIAVPEKSLPLLKQRLTRMEPADPQRVRRLLNDLDSNNFTIRETAFRKLKKLGVPAEPLLREALTKKPSLELRRRIEKILERPVFVQDPESLRRIRAIQVLEQIGTREARRILEHVASGVPHAPETQDAQAALHRLRGAKARESKD